MSELDAIRSIRRFERVKLVTSSLLVALCLVLISLEIQPANVLSAYSFAAIATTYAPVINLVLTIMLVLITACYTWVTYRMAVEISESRRASVRALLWLDLGRPELSQAEERDSRELATKIEIWNFGRGAAIAATFECSALYESDKEHTYISAEVQPPPPAVLAAGVAHRTSWSIPGFPTNMMASRDNFIEARVTYQDVEGNLYKFFATFDLQVIGNLRFWRRNKEVLYFLPFRNRKSLREEGRGVLGSVTEYIPIYERSFW